MSDEKLRLRTDVIVSCINGRNPPVSDFVKALENFGIETRPIISGSFINQPATKLYNLNKKNEKFEEAQKVEDLGFVIGLHTKKIKNITLEKIIDGLYLIDKIK